MLEMKLGWSNKCRRVDFINKLKIKLGWSNKYGRVDFVNKFQVFFFYRER